jgi:hypothetical protein
MVMPRGGAIALLVLSGIACVAATAAEPRSLALMDFELIDELRSYSSEQARREVDRRSVPSASRCAGCKRSAT